jgi:hypothetical protein
MAEIAGLILGTLALVGVFEDCIGLLSQIAAAKSMGQDYEILETKLDIEKTLLLQWADRLNIFNHDQYDPRLDNSQTRRIIERTLGCIRLLLQSSDELQSHYGVRLVKRNEDTQPSLPVSRRLMSQFHQQSHELTLWHDNQLHRLDQETQSNYLKSQNRRTGISSINKIKWIIKDKEKFENLIRNLSDLVGSLNKIVPTLEQDASTRVQLKQEIGMVHNIGMLNAILHASTGHNNDLVDEANKTITEECTRLILERLWFRLIDERKESIAEAHSETLGWALHPPTNTVAWSDLSKWLEFGRDIYWISGKPGSGKSTLMKFLFDHPHVKMLLKKWAGHRRLIMASVFLWNLGSVEQKTQQGLTRGLLYHVLSGNPALIPLALPDMWREAHIGTTELKLPSDREMSQAFARIGADTTHGAYAFFIDGLDEYSGDLRHGISFVQQLAKSANVKLLLSSRHIDTCVAAFSAGPKLALQDLTKKDIELYVSDTILSHHYVAELKALDETVTDRLIEDVQKKATGVFLWVVLACRSLLAGFAAYDSPKELQSRVDELPPELEDLFRHILGKISPRYLPQAAKLLNICYKSRLLGISDHISTLALAWADSNDLNVNKLQNFERCTTEDVRVKCMMLEGRLRSRCMGLLEVHQASIQYNSMPFHSRSYEVLATSSVDFMHRTVFEFLHSPGVWTMDCLQIDQHEFDATLVLSHMSSYLLYIREEPLGESEDTCFLAMQSVRYVKMIEKTQPCDTFVALRNLTLALMQKRKANVDGTTEQFFGVNKEFLPLNHAALLLAIEADLLSVVQEQEQDLLAFISSQARLVYRQPGQYPLLYHGINKPLLSQLQVRTWRLPSPEMIRFLSRSGCDLNETFLDSENNFTTLWEEWISSDLVSCMIAGKNLHAAQITLLMLRAGLPTVAAPSSNPVISLASGDPPGSPNPPAPKEWRDYLLTLAGEWRDAAENASTRSEQEALKECCDEITQIVGTLMTDNPRATPLHQSSAWSPH